MNANEENRPRKGDRFLDGRIVDFVTDDMVWFVVKDEDKAEFVQLENVAPAKEAGMWKLVGIKTTDDQGADE